jgi:hypothetical protein
MQELIFRLIRRTRHKIITAAAVFDVPVWRAIVLVCVIADFAALAWLAAEVRVYHHHGSLIAAAVLLLGAVCGLNYLRPRGPQ